MSPLEVRSLSLRYPGGVQALREVTLSIQPGMFGLLGPNGAGKSTLMRVLATLQTPDRGSVRLGELDLVREKLAVRRRLGYLPQEFGFDPRWTALRFLDQMAVLKGVHPKHERANLVNALLERVNLWEERKRHISGFSGGMKQRLGIAQAMIGDPSLIIVDEPTAGLDPAERQRFHDLLSELSQRVIVILSTHIVDDVRELCRDMAIIDRGSILQTGDPQREVAKLAGRVWKTTVERTELAALRARHAVISTRLLAGSTIAHVLSEESPGPGFSLAEANLEDVYFAVLRSRLN
jgi:ABC-type multidrug transport system ATPase subunit